MNRTVAGIATALAFIPATAIAGVSDDLVFCSKLAATKERVACYDAAARLAARGAATERTPARLVTREAADRPESAAPVVIASNNTFQGAFATIGGSYGISSPRQAQVFSPLFSLSDANVSDQFTAQGWSGRATAGYNATIGNFLFGVELAGRFGHEAAKANAAAVQPMLPFFGSFGPSSSSYDIKNDAGLHLAGRVGATFGDTLAFLRGGVGVSHIVETATSDARALTLCSGWNTSGLCTITAQGTLQAYSASTWVPSAVVGAGIEHNIGPAFVRLEAELEALSLHQKRLGNIGQSGNVAEPYWFARAIAAVGIRF